MTLAELRVHKEEILSIAAMHGARDVRVFGSVARGDARPDSDIDLLVKLDADRTVLDLSDLIMDLEEALGRKVDVAEILRPSRFGDQIQQEAVPL